jgi:uncharacterized protein YdeI (YjbR/CyaY-like superfamily)
VKRTFFASQAAFRAWLQKHHASKDELLIGFYKKASGKGGLVYKQALDEALCFGWIDGKVRGVDEHCYEQRFTPRRKGSHWSRVNIKRFGELQQLGLVTPAGVAAFEKRDESQTIDYSYEMRAAKFSTAFLEAFKANPKAWAFFQSWPPGRRRQSTFAVMSAKQEETRQRRFAGLLAECAAGIRREPMAPASDVYKKARAKKRP